jgi:hypothetical protein
MHLASSGDISKLGQLRPESTLFLTARLYGRTYAGTAVSVQGHENTYIFPMQKIDNPSGTRDHTRYYHRLWCTQKAVVPVRGA